MMSTKGKMYQPHNVNDILVMSHFLRMQALWLWTCVGKCPGASTELLTQGCLLPEECSVVIWHGYQEVPAIFLHVTTCSLAAPGSGAVSPSWSRWCSHTSFTLIFFLFMWSCLSEHMLHVCWCPEKPEEPVTPWNWKARGLRAFFTECGELNFILLEEQKLLLSLNCWASSLFCRSCSYLVSSFAPGNSLWVPVRPC